MVGEHCLTEIIFLYMLCIGFLVLDVNIMKRANQMLPMRRYVVLLRRRLQRSRDVLRMLQPALAHPQINRQHHSEATSLVLCKIVHGFLLCATHMCLQSFGREDVSNFYTY